MAMSPNLFPSVAHMCFFLWFPQPGGWGPLPFGTLGTFVFLPCEKWKNKTESKTRIFYSKERKVIKTISGVLLPHGLPWIHHTKDT